MYLVFFFLYNNIMVYKYYICILSPKLQLCANYIFQHEPTISFCAGVFAKLLLFFVLETIASGVSALNVKSRNKYLYFIPVFHFAYKCGKSCFYLICCFSNHYYIVMIRTNKCNDWLNINFVLNFVQSDVFIESSTIHFNLTNLSIKPLQ